MPFDNIRKIVFFPVVVIVGVLCVLSLLFSKEFIDVATIINNFIINRLGAVFAIAPLIFLVLCVVIYVSPVGKIRIGGELAQPLLSRLKWFSITICTTIATGLLFWGTAEPLFHLSSPPQQYADATDKTVFAMSALYMHWSILPYAIYSLAGLAFAIGYYNKRLPFRVGTMWFAFKSENKFLYNTFDGLSLFSLVAGMAASLGVGILLLSNGLALSSSFEYNRTTSAIITVLIVSTFIVSSVSGLQKGIAQLSTLNLILLGLLLITFVFNLDSTNVGTLVANGFKHFVFNGLNDSLLYFSEGNNTWAKTWTVFNWANWMAWTPITALFLGRIAYGRTIREFLVINLILPSMFCIVWLSIVSGTALNLNQQTGGTLVDLLGKEGGVGNVIFSIIQSFKLGNTLIYLFLLTVFLSFVTAADSNTEAMSGLSSTDISPENPSSSPIIKIIWGVFIGVLAWVMVAFSVNGTGLDGVRILSNVGGVSALIILLGVIVNMVIYLIQETKNAKKNR